MTSIDLSSEDNSMKVQQRMIDFVLANKDPKYKEKLWMKTKMSEFDDLVKINENGSLEQTDERKRQKK